MNFKEQIILSTESYERRSIWLDTNFINSFVYLLIPESML